MLPTLPRRRSSASSTGSAVAFLSSQHVAKHKDSTPISPEECERHNGDADNAKDCEIEDCLEAESESGELSADFESKLSRNGQRLKWWKIYAMHFLFMWNTETFGYASILLVALAFPQSLAATSIRGIASTVSAMICSPAVGSWIDRSSSRLPPLVFTIVINHGALVSAYLCWLLWPSVVGPGGVESVESQSPFSSLSKGFLFGFILFLDILQHLSSIANKFSLERDWVPVLVDHAAPNITYGLTQVNAVMRRIELLCKLVAPSLLPLIISVTSFRSFWIMLLAAMTIMFWAIEVWFAHIIARDNPQLCLPKVPLGDEATIEDDDIVRRSRIETVLPSRVQKVYRFLYLNSIVRLTRYFSMAIWPASISAAIIQLTVLAYSATLITYLLEIGFSLSAITIAKASGSIMSLLSTFITPLAVRYVRKRQASQELGTNEDEAWKDDGGQGVTVRRVGLWGISSQFLSLVPVVIVLWNLSPKSVEPASSQDTNPDSLSRQSPSLIVIIILFSSLSLSRIGHWMYELMIQELEQVEVPSSERSTFAGTEESFRSLFELCHWAATVFWSRPEDFRWLALGSLIVFGIGGGIYAIWVGIPRRRKVAYEVIDMGNLDSVPH